MEISSTFPLSWERLGPHNTKIKDPASKSKLGPTHQTTVLIASGETKNDYDDSILFQNRQPKFAKISISIDSRTLHAVFIIDESTACLCSCAHKRSQCVPRKSTCMYVFVGMLSKTISFLQMRAAAPKLLHITAHIRAAEPNSKSFPILQPILLAQSLKKMQSR
jgi:hypothetical protein